MVNERVAYMNLIFQEESTGINVRGYWPPVVASGAMLLATDALSIERTLGTYMLSACDVSKSQLAEFAYLQGSADLLLKFANTYDPYVGKLLKQRIIETWLQRNITELRNAILSVNFIEMCRNLTDVRRNEMTLEWANDMQLYILTMDELRGSFIIPSILQVKLSVTSILQRSIGLSEETSRKRGYVFQMMIY